VKVVPIRYTHDVAAVIRFYQVLGLDLGSASRPGAWVEMPAASGMLAVHQAHSDKEAGQCELAFESDEPLENVAARLQDAGFETGPVIDENFGQSLRVRDPDGVWVQINLNDRELYT
jgi:catechol 2,3-dioxygenase-like lactoylglutathione lyase family enzyme